MNYVWIRDVAAPHVGEGVKHLVSYWRLKRDLAEKYEASDIAVSLKRKQTFQYDSTVGKFSESDQIFLRARFIEPTFIDPKDPFLTAQGTVPVNLIKAKKIARFILDRYAYSNKLEGISVVFVNQVEGDEVAPGLLSGVWELPYHFTLDAERELDLTDELTPTFRYSAEAMEKLDQASLDPGDQ